MNKHLFLVLLIICSGVYSTAARGESAPTSSALTTQLNKSSFTIGEKIVVTVTGKVPNNATIAWPQKIEGLKSIALINTGYRLGLPLFNQRRFKGWFELKGFEPGEYEIPPISIKVLDPTKNEENLLTPKLNLHIKELVAGDVEKTSIKDIKGFYRPWSVRMILFILGLIVSLGAWLIYVKVTTKPSVKSETPRIPAHVIALEKIKKLEQEDLISRGLVPEFYFELSMIVRQYLEARFFLRAPEMTTEEFLTSLKVSQALSPDHKQLLRNFLSHCDMVKFAQYGPERDEIFAALCSAKKLIEETIPQ